MLTLLLTLLWMGRARTQSETVVPGPPSGIVLREQPGLLITNCRTHTQRVFVRLDPYEVYRTHYPNEKPQASWAGVKWTQDALHHAAADTTYMLQQLQKMTVTQAELSGSNPRPKRFLGALLGAAAAVGTLFNIGFTTVNAINLATVRRHVSELQDEIPKLQEQIRAQKEASQAIGKTVQGTIVVVNTHSVILNQTVKAVNQLFHVLQNDYAHTQVVSLLMGDMLREISSSLDSLAMGRIPPYLVPLSLVQDILAGATRGAVQSIQAHLAYSLGSAIPLYVDPILREVAFLVNLPIIDPNSIYRLKDVINVGFWRGDTYVRLHTPDVVAYHDSNPELYLAPNLRMCTQTKDIHYLCPSKPFVRDNTEGICGLEPMRTDSSCAAEVTPRSQVFGTQAEIVGSQWLINTPSKTAMLTYDQHDTATRITLPNQTLWANVPKGAILHVDDLALYHLPTDTYETTLEVSPFFKEYSFELDPALEQRIQYEGTQTIDLKPLNDALQALTRQPVGSAPTLGQTWTPADTVLCIALVLGQGLTLLLAVILFRRYREVKSQFDKCATAYPRLFRNRKRQTEPPTEQVGDLIEVTPLPPRRDTTNSGDP